MRPGRATLRSSLVPALALVALWAGAGEPVGGELVSLRGVKVLRLRGSPRERGYAHGYLLAREISGLVVRYLPLVARDGARYRDGIRAEVRDRFAFPEALREEAAGIFEGLRAALGEERLPTLHGAPIDELDILAMQALPDWYPFACSAFVAWGALAPEGPVAGRNMDFFVHPALLESHVLVVHERQGASRAHVSLGWPGLAGSLTGLNEDGVCAFILDAAPPPEGPPPRERRGFLARMAAARLVLEKARPEEPARDAFALVSEKLSRWGGNLFVAGPEAGRLPAAAGVVETDALGSSLRLAGAETVSARAPAFVCTNHFRLRARPEPCLRYAILSRGLDSLQESGLACDFERAFGLLREAAQPITMQSLVVNLRTRELALRLATPDRRAEEAPPVRLGWEELAGTPARR